MKENTSESLVIDEISFNRDWAKTKTEEQFVAEGEASGWYAGVKNKAAKLKEAYKLLVAKDPEPEAATDKK